MNEIIKSDFQKIVDVSLNNAEQLMSELINIYPFGVTMDLDGTTNTVNVWDGNDHPNPIDIINDLKTVFERDLKVKVKVTAITYDVLAIDPSDKIKKMLWQFEYSMQNWRNLESFSFLTKR